MKKSVWAILVLLMLGTGCSRDVTYTPFPSPTKSPTPVITTAPTQSSTPLSSPTPQRSITPTFTLVSTPAPDLPVHDGDLLAPRQTRIEPSNLDNFTELARWGYGDVLASAYNQPANILLVQSTERTSLYDAETLEPFLTLRGSPGSAILSTKGDMFALVSPEGIEVWDVEEKKVTTTIDFPGNKCLDVNICDGLPLPYLSFSPDSLQLAALSLPAEPENPNHRELWIWNIPDGSVVRRQRLSDSARSFLFNASWHILAVEVGERLEVWDTVQWRQMYSTQEGRPILNYAFSPDGSQIAVQRSSDVRIHQVEDGSIVRSIIDRQADLFSFDLWWAAETEISSASLPDGSLIATSPDRTKMLFVTERDQQVELRSIPGGELIGTLPINLPSTQRAYFTADSTAIVVVETDGIRKWSSDRGILMHSHLWNAVVDNPLGLTISSTGRLIIHEEDHWKLIESTDGSLLSTSENPMVLMPNGDIFEILPNGPHTTLVRVSDGSSIYELRYAGEVYTANLSANGAYLLTQGEQHSSIQLWEMPEAERVRGLYTGPLVSSAFTPDGAILTTTGNVTGYAPSPDQVLIRLWESTTGRLLQSANGVVYRVLAFSPEGDYFIADSPNGNLNVYQTSDLSRSTMIDNPAPGIRYTSAAFSIDGELLFAARGDGLLVVWDTSDWDGVLVQPTHHGGSFYLALSPDGTTLVSAGADATLRLWGIWP